MSGRVLYTQNSVFGLTYQESDLRGSHPGERDRDRDRDRQRQRDRERNVLHSVIIVSVSISK